MLLNDEFLDRKSSYVSSFFGQTGVIVFLQRTSSNTYLFLYKGDIRYNCEYIFFFFPLEIDLLSLIKNSPLDFNVRTIFTPERKQALLFGRAIKRIQANEDLLNKVIFNVESSSEFIIKTRFRIMARPAGALFSIVHSQRKLFLLDLSSKGVGDKTKLILKYRSTNDTTENVVFKDVTPLADRSYHTVVIRITDVKEHGKKISALSLFVDCHFFGRVDTKSAISDIFSYRGTLLSLLDFRIAQRGFGGKIHTQWKVININF